MKILLINDKKDTGILELDMFRKYLSKNNKIINLNYNDENTLRNYKEDSNITTNTLFDKIVKHLVLSVMAIKKGYRLIREEKIDILFTMGAYLPLGIPCCVLKKLTNKPYIIKTSAENKKVIYMKYKPNKLMKLIIDNIEKRIFNSSIAVIVQSNKEKQRLVNIIDSSKLFVISQGVNTEIFKPLPRNRGKRLNIGYIGRLHFLKGLKYLIDAYTMLPKKEKTRLIIVGDELYKRELNEMISKNRLNRFVIIKNSVSHERVAEIINKIDILVLPSLSEGLPNILLEAMSMKKAIIATNVGGIPALIKNNVTGLLVEPGNTKQITRALTMLIEDEELRKELGKNAREEIIRKHKMEDCGKKIGLLLNLIEEKIKC